MDFALSTEQHTLLTRVREFMDEHILPLEDEVQAREVAGEAGLAREQLLELQQEGRKRGLWGISTPVEHGGMGLESVMQSLVNTEYGRTFVPFEFGGKADNILFHGNNSQQEEFLRPTLEGQRISCFAITEPDAGSDARAIKGTATRTPNGGWKINATKKYIGYGHDADFVIVFVRAVDSSSQDQGITCFLVDRDRGWTSRLLPAMGERRIAELTFEDVEVPDSCRLGEIGQGFDLAMQWIGNGRVLIPSRVIGSAQRLVTMGVERAQSRETFGHKLAEYQGIQWQLADSVIELEEAKWVTLYAAWRGDTGLETRFASSLAKLSATTMANRVVDRVLQIHGALGYTKELPLERWYRELRYTRIYEGADEIMRRTVANDLFKGRYVADNLLQLAPRG